MKDRKTSPVEDEQIAKDTEHDAMQAWARRVGNGTASKASANARPVHDPSSRQPTFEELRGMYGP